MEELDWNASSKRTTGLPTHDGNTIGVSEEANPHLTYPVPLSRTTGGGEDILFWLLFTDLRVCFVERGMQQNYSLGVVLPNEHLEVARAIGGTFCELRCIIVLILVIILYISFSLYVLISVSFV